MMTMLITISPLLLVFFGIEATKTNEQHKANLLAAEMEDGESLAFEGKHSIEQFIMWLDGRAEKGRHIVVAHNFQGYAGILWQMNIGNKTKS